VAVKVTTFNETAGVPPTQLCQVQATGPARAYLRTNGEDEMNHLLLKLHMTVQSLTCDVEGQDLVEYALLVCLIALAAISGVKHVATAVTTVFSNGSTSLA